MRFRFHFHSLLLASALLVAGPAVVHAAENTNAPGKLIPVTEQHAEWAANARKDYPLTTCVVADEQLGSMGAPAEYLYRVDGQPDRLVVFCCSGCEEDFLADPEAHLKKLAKAKASGGKTSGNAQEGHGKGHHHH